MILSIGNKRDPFNLKRWVPRAGFSFIEIMVAMMILATGIVFIYKSFFVSLGYMNHVTNRLVALSLLDNRIADMELLLKTKGALSLAGGSETKRVVIQQRTVDFHFETELRSVESIPGLYQVDLNLSWEEGTRGIRVGRTVYISS